MDVWGIVPHVREGGGYWCYPSEEDLQAHRVITEIREPDYYLPPDPEGLFDNIVRVPDLLEALVQYNVVERAIPIFGQSAVNVAVMDTEPLFNTGIYGLFAELYPLPPDLIFLLQQVEEIPFPAP